MEIRYSNDVVLHVKITEQMVKDWKEHNRLASIPAGEPMDCEKCSLNINLDEDGSLGLCELKEVRGELNRLAGIGKQ